MKLYKQEIIKSDTTKTELVLISEGASMEELKRKAERLARLDGFIEFIWEFGDNRDEYTQMNVGEKYLFIIRAW